MRNILLLLVILSFSTISHSSEKLEKISNIDELNYFIHTYYLQPQPELIDSAITVLGSSDIAAIPNAKMPVLMSFSCLFAQYDAAHKKKWTATIQSIPEPTKSILKQAINKTPSELLKPIPTSPQRNDMNWACFFATGDSKYLNDIIFTLKHLDNRDDFERFLTASSAKWSLSSNAKTHFIVKMSMEAMKVGDVPEMRGIAEEILNKSPRQIRDETIAIIKEQRDKGKWKQQ
ncbi:hypothetical protein [Thiomicrorhabdus sp.]|uniref:hypothetical protein n=1 Tax=Thiomicrorhabdus sp. TaxID=2039724 RepID=UPI0029C872D9|nr:hypothetical protein [Thiomicrorhabdus sp.]